MYRAGYNKKNTAHWLALDLPHGRIALRILLFIRPEAASKAKRDATPLRLISWLSYKLNPELELFIEEAMEHLSTWKESEGGKVLTMGQKAIQQGEAINTEMELRDRLIDLVRFPTDLPDPPTYASSGLAICQLRYSHDCPLSHHAG